MLSEPIPTLPERSKPDSLEVWPGRSSGEAREQLIQVGPHKILTSSLAFAGICVNIAILLALFWLRRSRP